LHTVIFGTIDLKLHSSVDQSRCRIFTVRWTKALRRSIFSEK